MPPAPPLIPSPTNNRWCRGWRAGSLKRSPPPRRALLRPTAPTPAASTRWVGGAAAPRQPSFACSAVLRLQRYTPSGTVQRKKPRNPNPNSQLQAALARSQSGARAQSASRAGARSKARARHTRDKALLLKLASDKRGQAAQLAAYKSKVDATQQVWGRVRIHGVACWGRFGQPSAPAAALQWVSLAHGQSSRPSVTHAPRQRPAATALTPACTPPHPPDQELCAALTEVAALEQQQPARSAAAAGAGRRAERRHCWCGEGREPAARRPQQGGPVSTAPRRTSPSRPTPRPVRRLRATRPWPRRGPPAM